MKKITLLILLAFFSISGYSQFTPALEGFENTTGPTPLPSTTWTLGTGNWAVFDNAVGVGQRWGINSTVAVPPIVYQGTNSAYVNRENIGQGNTSEDYLASPLVNIPTNGELRFFTRMFTTGNQGTIYQIRVAPSTASQTDPAAYTVVQQWTEADLITTYNLYEEKVVPLAAYAGQQVYVSFVKVYTQLGTGIDGDRWLVDNVTIVEKCLEPTTLTFTAVTSNSASLNWVNPSGATSWEIEVVPATGTPTGIGAVYSGSLPYIVTGLLPNTAYKFYVRALCSSGFPSLWVGPSATFTTSAAPPECGGNFVDSGNTTANYSNNENITTTICPTIPGEQVTVTFTSFNTEANWDGLYVYNGNTVTPTELLASANGPGNVPGGLAGSYWGNTIPGPFTSNSADGCLTFVFRSDGSGVFSGWVSNVTCLPPPVCQQPSGLTATAILSNTVTLGWTNNGLATSWEVLALPCGSPAPTAASTGWIATSTNPYVFTGLSSATCYDLYVRGNCSSTSNGVSLWAGPRTVTTQLAPPVCGGNFVDSGGVAGNYANNANVTTTICPTNPGEKVTVTFTSFNTEANWDGLYVYNGNSVTPSQLLPSANGGGNVPGGLAGSYWGNLTGANLPGPFTSTSADGCLTFVFRSDASFNNPGWVSNITCALPPACQQPTNLTTANITTTSVEVGWVSPGTATSWQVIALPAGSPAPLPTETGWTAAPTNPFVLGGLTPGTAYEYYVRGDCGATDGVSLWSGPRAFSTVPTCPPPTTLTTSAVLSTSVQLNWDTVTPSLSWQVLALPCGSPAPTAASTGWIAAPTNPFVYAGLSPTTCYDFYVRGVCSDTDISFWSPVATVTTQVAPPVCGGTFTDPGGPTANYANGTDSTVTICPAIAGQVVTVTFTSFNTEANWDGLYVFDGNSIAATQIASTNPAANVPGGLPGSFWGTTIPGPFTSSSADGCLTFRFRSDGSVNNPGWIANVTCDPPPTCRRPASFTATTVTSNSTILNWIQPTNPDNSVASAWQVLALPCGSPAPTAASTGFVDVLSGPPYTLTGLNSSTCYDIYIRAVCSPTDSSTWSGPATITTQVAPPVCGGVFVDPGGPNNYLNNTDSTVTVCPTNPNEVVTVTFTSFATEQNWDALYVFDGMSITDPLIASTNGAGNVPGGLAGGYWGNTIPGPFTSSSNDGCLTFRFRSDGSGAFAGWVANVTCDPAPNCLKPTNLTATNITTTSASLGWTESNPLVTQWEVIILPLGSPFPLPSATGTLVSANPALITGLQPGTQYTFYVRAICPTSGTSAWSVGFNFNTLLANDDCSGATFAAVNSSAVCQQITPGSIAGATASATPALAPCVGTADDDVWFQFIATNSYLNVALQNITGTTTDLNFAAYSGQCGTLTNIFCSAPFSVAGVLNNLIVGNTYYIRVYSNSATPQSTTFNLCISTPSTCPTASTVCSLTNYANTTGVTSLGTIGCLFTSPNPAYFTIQVATSGPINFLLTQSSTIGGAPNIDVDYAAWGPFADQAAACTAIGGPLPTLPPGIGVPVTQQTGCSYSAAATENLNIANAVAGQIYIVLITNFSNQAGYINLTQTNAGTPGAGGTLCCPDAYFSYTPVSYCKEVGVPNPIPVIANGSVAGVFSSTIIPGLVFVNTATGEIDLQASAPGNYVVTNTVAATAECVEKVKSFTINITEPTTATIAYASATYCKSITALQNVIFTGATGGSYSANPNGGLYIDANTGSINPNLSAPGVYTVTYALPGAGICVSSNPTTTVEIIATPNIVQPSVSVCNTYTLPALTVGNYYTDSQANGGTLIDASIPITTTQTIYIYANNGGCTDEESFTVTINSAPTPTVNVTQPTCAVQTGTIEVTSPLSTGGGLPANLFISEVTDSNAGALTYIEIYNGTGAAVDLSNYKLRTFNNGSATVTSPCDNTLSGMLSNNSTFVVAVGSATNQGSVVPNLSFTSCTGVNVDDNIRLSTTADVDVDVWGRIDGTTFTPAGQPGYTYRRNGTATVPSTTWNPADWTALDPEDYTNVGSYTLPASGYQYILDNGTPGAITQTSVTFSNVAPGTHTVTVLDSATGCLSLPVTVTLSIVTQNPSVTTFSYPTTPVCQNGATNPVPDTSAAGFTTGGTFSSTGGLDIDPTTGVITLANSTANTYVVTYAVLDNPLTCTQAGSSTFTIVINPVITPVTGFSYTTPVCKNGTNPTPITVGGFTAGGTYSSTTGLDINATTGVINLVNSNAGTYTVTYTVAANTSATVCQVAGSSTFNITITPVITPVTAFTYASPVCSSGTNPTPIPSTGFTTGGVYSSTAGLTLNAATGEITLPSTPGTYTVTYTVAADASTCQVASSATAQIVISAPIQISVAGDCEGVNFVMTATPIDGSFDPASASYVWVDSSGLVVGNTQNIIVTDPDTYTVTVTSSGCSNTGTIVVDAITCVIQKGISANNDGLNDSFDLRGLNVKNLSIFNRYGMKVYSRGNYTDEWKGQSDKGDELPDGTYYFVIERDNGETKTGWIYINRAQ